LESVDTSEHGNRFLMSSGSDEYVCETFVPTPSASPLSRKVHFRHFSFSGSPRSDTLGGTSLGGTVFQCGPGESPPLPLFGVLLLIILALPPHHLSMATVGPHAWDPAPAADYTIPAVGRPMSSTAVGGASRPVQDADMRGVVGRGHRTATMLAAGLGTRVLTVPSVPRS